MIKKKYCVKDYGAKADGITNDSIAVQKAIDIAHSSGGGEVLFPEGTYVLSTVFLKSNVHIRFSDRTKILGSLDYYEYAQIEQVDYPVYQDTSHTYFDNSMFVGKGCENISITGAGIIDMRSVWDTDDVKGEENRKRGPKFIALKECKDVVLGDMDINNVTDIAIYFAGCENVDVHGIKMKVYIDGISPDNSKNVKIYDCDIDSGDDGIVLKSSYTLNRLDICKNIKVWDCKVKSRCNALKIGTETNGGFENIEFDNIEVYETRISGIAIESVDGAVIDGVVIKNINMKNVNAPIFVHIGKRMRGPKGRSIGSIKNVTLENITASGPYIPYEAMPPNYVSFEGNDRVQYPWIMNFANIGNEELRLNGMNTPWQQTSNICGIKGNPVENIILRNVHLKVDGGVSEYSKEVPDDACGYPEVWVYGVILPAKGIYFRHAKNLVTENVAVETYRPDIREDFVYEAKE